MANIILFVSFLILVTAPFNFGDPHHINRQLHQDMYILKEVKSVPVVPVFVSKLFKTGNSPVLVSSPRATKRTTTEICKIRTRILHEGERFEPRRCFVCECRNSSLSCQDEDPAACPEPPCDPSVQISTPDRCCKICPGVGSRCRFNGMSVEDGESFQLHPSGFCECHDGKLTCVRDSPLNSQSNINIASM